MANSDDPIKAYPSENLTGWYAVNKHGRTWPITSQEASKLPKGKPIQDLLAACRL